MVLWLTDARLFPETVRHPIVALTPFAWTGRLSAVLAAWRQGVPESHTSAKAHGRPRRLSELRFSWSIKREANRRVND